MDILTKELNKKFKDKYLHLKLLEINYNSQDGECEFVFLYSHMYEDIPKSDREEIQSFLEEYIKLHSKLIVKYKRSFLDDHLVVKKVIEFLEKNYKSIACYILKEDISSSFNNTDLSIQIVTADEVKRFFEANNIATRLIEFLQKQFFADITFEIKSDKNKVIETEIKRENSVIIKPKTERYKVNVVSKGFGGDIMPNPELIKNINSSKLGCILGGNIEGLKKAEYTQKKAKPGKEPEQKVYYNFTLNDGSGKVPVVYFATTLGVKVMDSLEDGLFIIAQGDIRKNNNDRPTMYIKKLALAERVNKEEQKEEQSYTNLPEDYIKIQPEKIENLKQDNLFKKIVYNKNITNNTFVVFDVETTGLEAEFCEIVEIAAVKVQNGSVTEKFETLVKPVKEIPESVIKIHGITNEMVMDAPKIEDIIVDFFKFVKGTVLSGYNVGFDMKFVEAAGRKIGLVFDNEVQDVMTMARMAGLKSKNLKLTTVCKELDIKLSNAHRAFYDTLATAELLLKLNEEKLI